MALTRATFAMIKGEAINALDYMTPAQVEDVTSNTGAVDVTTALQAAIDAGLDLHKQVYLPAGKYKVTSTLTVYDGSQLYGESDYAYGAGFGRDPKGTKISFEPPSLDDLFDYQYDPTPTPTPPVFLFHTSMSNLYMTTNSNGRRAININAVIYGRFTALTIEGFDTGIYCYGTINNRFESVYISDCDNECVLYAGQAETTDVWDSCSFIASTSGVVMAGDTVGIRFNSCLWEQIDNYGIDLAREVQCCMVSDAYCEDVPYSTGASTAAMFRVGYQGATTSTVNQLIVHGGVFQGRSAGIHGSCFDINHSKGVIAQGFGVSRYVNAIRVNTTNTTNNSIVLGGFGGVSNTNNIVNNTGSIDLSKIAGFFANGVMNSGAYNQTARFFDLTANQGLSISSLSGLISFATGAIIQSGSGSPEGSVTAPPGSLWLNGSGGANTTLYVKESGTGNTGWVAK